MSISLSPIAETAGDIIAIVRDVTEHRAFEERVRQSERRLAGAQRLAHLGSWDWDIVGNALKWSDEMCRIFGTTQEEFGGDYQAFLGALHDDDRARVQEAVSRAVDGVEPYETDYRVVHPDSTERIVHAQGEVTFTCDGMPTRMFGTVLDITDRRHAEEELEKYRSHLEDIVEERTRELEEARDRAEAADKLKSAFLAAMSHELRTPLNSIIGFVGILLKELPGPLNDEQQLQLGMVQTSSRHLLELINDVLDISKLEADQLELRVAPFDMQDSVEKVLKTVSPLAEEKKLSLVSDVRLDERQLTSDSRRVEQILLNLVGNAIKFTDRGSVTIECTANQELITTRISDTGIGIRSEDIGSVFESFRQVDSGLSRQREGTGLGLSISKKLVEMLGGTIGCQSTLGVGSTFEFSLPLLWKD